jgi:two-component system chemotaxis response regulator CheY
MALSMEVQVRKLKALVVDDSKVMRQMVMQLIRKTELADFEFIEAQDGNDALHKFNPRSTDIMFVDWNMPEMNGIDFVKRVRATGKTEHIPIVMVTSEKTMGKVQEALDKAGANEYITKPFTVEEMARKLSKLMQTMPAHEPNASSGSPGGLLEKIFRGG